MRTIETSEVVDGVRNRAMRSAMELFDDMYGCAAARMAPEDTDTPSPRE